MKNKTLILLILAGSISYSDAENPEIGCNPPPSTEVTIKPFGLSPTGVKKLSETIELATSGVKLSPFKYESGRGDTEFDAKITLSEKCCDCAIKIIGKVEGTGTVDLGKITGIAKFPLGPTGVVCFAKGSIGVSVEGTASASGTCSEPIPVDICISFGGNITGSLTVGLALVDESVASVQGTLAVSGSATAEWCTQGGLKDKEVCLKVTISTELTSFLGSVRLWNNNGDPLYQECL